MDPKRLGKDEFIIFSKTGNETVPVMAYQEVVTMLGELYQATSELQAWVDSQGLRYPDNRDVETALSNTYYLLLKVMYALMKGKLE